MSRSIITANMDDAITALFDAITNFDCVTRQDILDASTLRNIPDVDSALAWIRQPDIAAAYGWTVPHVRRGRAYQGQTYRYMVVDPSGGGVLSDEAIKLIKEGTLSTVRQVSTTTTNLAEALLMTRSLSVDTRYKKWAKDIAGVLNGVSIQAGLEAERLRQFI